MRLSQLFFHMLTPQALKWMNVADRYGSDLIVSMNQYH